MKSNKAAAAVLRLAHHLPSGHFDNAQRGILTDALVDAGCESREVVEHCRGEGPHVQGCWVIDLVLKKE